MLHSKIFHFISIKMVRFVLTLTTHKLNMNKNKLTDCVKSTPSPSTGWPILIFQHMVLVI